MDYSRFQKRLTNTILSEHQEQVNFVDQFESTYPDVRLLSIPNGGLRRGKTVVGLKKEGLKPGVPDLFIPAWGIWIEMKRLNGGTVSKVQKDWIGYLKSIGYTVFVCHGCADAMSKMNDFHNRHILKALGSD